LTIYLLANIFFAIFPKRFRGSMNYDPKDKVIIITGANSGIGKAASIQLARCGATVVMACRWRERTAQALWEVACVI
jgi:NADPH:quinone reductase-like Zn-dependent oxidoreductase